RVEFECRRHGLPRIPAELFAGESQRVLGDWLIEHVEDGGELRGGGWLPLELAVELRALGRAVIAVAVRLEMGQVQQSTDCLPGKAGGQAELFLAVTAEARRSPAKAGIRCDRRLCGKHLHHAARG